MTQRSNLIRRRNISIAIAILGILLVVFGVREGYLSQKELVKLDQTVLK